MGLGEIATAYNEIKGERMLACSQPLRHLFFEAEMPQEVGSFGAANAADEFCPNSTGRDFCLSPVETPSVEEGYPVLHVACIQVVRQSLTCSPHSRNR